MKVSCHPMAKQVAISWVYAATWYTQSPYMTLYEYHHHTHAAMLAKHAEVPPKWWTNNDIVQQAIANYWMATTKINNHFHTEVQ